ncbi:hypothetical protein SCHPADRAFT_894904 [Schizopora paradoxa]|uniref:Uncharacterized protein n=1 Tax=Schizopora paradoxa TaxID=27342 RepID=A0A0H2R5M2_9AGAM|nr:hypothetical protein SCHPADRAFT_894904 [Schizopora paradoxa]
MTATRRAAGRTASSSKSTIKHKEHPSDAGKLESNPLSHRNANGDDNNEFSSSEESDNDLFSVGSDFDDLPDATTLSADRKPQRTDPPHNAIPVEGFEHLQVEVVDPTGQRTNPQSQEEENGMEVDASALSPRVSAEEPAIQNAGSTATTESATNHTTRPTQVSQRPTLGNLCDTYASERTLPYVAGLMLATDRPHVTVVTLEKSFPKEDDYELKRIRMLSTLKGNSKIRNLSLCEPGSLSLLERKFLKHGLNDSSSLFFLTGIAKYTGLFDDSLNSRQVGFLPFATTWYRAVSVLGNVFESKVLYFASYQGAITMSTKTRNASSSSTTQPGGLTRLDEEENTVSPSDTWALNYDSRVPVFDGRYRLNFNDLRECPEYRRELQPGSAIAPIFTVHSYHPYGQQLSKHRIQKTDTIISFNIRAIIYVKEPHPYFNHKQILNARDEALGVTFPPAREEPIANREATRDANDEYGDLVSDSPMDTDSITLI